MKKQQLIIILILMLANIINVKAAGLSKIIINKSLVQNDTTYYVLANSGLNYRATPNGEVLGTFPLMTKLKIVERTGVFLTIKEKEEDLKGEWVGVIKKGTYKKVYVFDGYLFPKETITSFDIYDCQGYEENKKEHGFIVLTDGYRYNTPGDVIDKKYLGDNKAKQHRLNKEYRSVFLFKIGFEETDSVYIYNQFKEEGFIFKVKELPLLARTSPYGTNDFVEEYEYLIGFDLKGKIIKNEAYESYAYIGKENPFVKSKLVPIVWRNINESVFPDVTIVPEYDKQAYTEFKNKDIKECYSFKNESYTYYLKIKEKENMYAQAFHLFVLLKDKVVYNEFFASSEGATPSPLNFNNAKYNKLVDAHQYTGLLFKNKPPVIFGLMYYSFGCPGIDFLDTKEKSISIKCDNRH